MLGYFVMHKLYGWGAMFSLELNKTTEDAPCFIFSSGRKLAGFLNIAADWIEWLCLVPPIRLESLFGASGKTDSSGIVKLPS